MADYDLQMALPKDKPMLQSTSSGNWTRPDNIFCTLHTLDTFTICNTAPRCQLPCTDHIPIYSTLDLNIPQSTTTTTFNYHDVEWDEFHGRLLIHLSEYPELTAITTEEQFQIAAVNPNNALKCTIEDKVLKTKRSLHAKRWWTKELSQMLKHKNKLSAQLYKLRGLPDHPIHEEHRHYCNIVTEAIHKTKQEHWITFLKELDQQSIYMANRYVTNPIGD
ncbi:hypothetical protein BDR06DRAFT_882700, partial [Suillus hirtellus]